MVAVLDHHLARLVLGMAGEPGAEEFAEVRPVVLGAGRRVHPGETATRLDVTGEAFLPCRGQHLAAGGEEDHGRVPVQRGLQGRRFLGVVDDELAQPAYGGDGGRDGVVAVVGGAGVHEQAGGHGDEPRRTGVRVPGR